MADEQTPAKGTEGKGKTDELGNEASGAKLEEGKADEQKPEAKTDADIEEIASKADKPDAVRQALQAEREAAKAARKQAEDLAAKVKQFEDRNKSEQQKLEEKATEADKRATTAEATLLRYKVAVAKKLPLDLAERLQGDTEKKLEADADRLLELVKPDGKPSGDADAGKGEGGGGTSFNDLLRTS